MEEAGRGGGARDHRRSCRCSVVRWSNPSRRRFDGCTRTYDLCTRTGGEPVGPRLAERERRQGARPMQGVSLVVMAALSD